MVSPHLPLEIHDHILDHLWDDRRTLAACSLACRAWLPTTRLHIFYSLKLRRPAHCHAFSELLNCTLVSSGDIARCVRDLSLGIDIEDEDTTPSDGVTFWMEHAIPPLLKKLERVQCLRVVGFWRDSMWWDIDEWEEENINAIQDVILSSMFLPSVTELCLEFVAFQQSDDMLKLLVACPNLSSLRMSNVTWVEHSPPQARSFPLIPQGEDADNRLTFSILAVDFISYIALLHAFALHAVHKLFAVHDLQWVDHWPNANSFIRVDLIKRAETFLRLVDNRTPRDKQIFSSVHSLHFKPNSDRGACRIPTYIDLFYRSSGVKPDHIRFLFGRFILDADFRLSNLPWEQFADRLAQAHLAHPQLAITFQAQVLHDMWMDEMVEIINTRFPALQAQGARIGVLYDAHLEDGSNNVVHREHWWPQA